jgi:hypothetical protein
MMNTPTAWKPSPDILSQASLRIVSVTAAMLLQSGCGRTPCWKVGAEKMKIGDEQNRQAL